MKKRATRYTISSLLFVCFFGGGRGVQMITRSMTMTTKRNTNDRTTARLVFRTVVRASVLTNRMILSK